MTQNEVFLQRLAYIKHLWLQAEEQAQQTEPFCGFALLPMQDAIEMFLLTGIAKKGCKSGTNDSFDKIWETLDKKVGLTQQTVIRQLNKARVDLKHHSVFPSNSQVNEFVIHARTFLNENTLNVFDIEFEQISLADLIVSDEIREHLKKAEKFQLEQKFSDSVAESAIAFAKLTTNLNKETRNKNNRINPISDFYDTLNSLKIHPEYSTFGGGSSREMKCTQSLAKQTQNFLDLEKDNARKMDAFLLLHAIGIPYGRYIRFQFITPNVRQSFNGAYNVPIILPEVTNSASVQFCISFVVECALKVQGFILQLKNI
ncbi:MAG: hypothetical protein WCT77_00850 [Bacteroidota bacterium]